MNPAKAPPGSGDDAFTNALVGTLISQSFVVQKKLITFLIGGGGDDGNLRVELLVQTTDVGPNTIQIDGQTFAVAKYSTGHGQETMHRAYWDVSAPGLMNRTARIRIMDNSTGGHLNVVDEADFFAAMSIFYWLKADVDAGRITEQTVMGSINTIVNAYSANYSGQYSETDLSGGSRAHIANYALGLLAGIKDWPIGSDFTPDKTATTKIGKAVYRTRSVPNYQIDPDVALAPDYMNRYVRLLKIWNDYQKVFGANTPMKRCRSGSKQWDINFEGVAHYVLQVNLPAAIAL